jgi:hypothetical protein
MTDQIPTPIEPIETDVAGEACEHLHFHTDYDFLSGEPFYTCADCKMVNDGHGWYQMQEEE